MSHAGTTKRMVDSAEARFAKLRRINPIELVSQLNGQRLDRLIHDIPETIGQLQAILTAAQQRKKELGTRK